MELKILELKNQIESLEERLQGVYPNEDNIRTTLILMKEFGVQRLVLGKNLQIEMPYHPVLTAPGSVNDTR